MKYRLLSFLILLWAIQLAAADPAEQLASANTAYQKNDFSNAIEQYEALLQQGYRSEALFYNLGNSYYRNNEYGKAVLNYERALLLDPNDLDTKHNLQIVRQQLPDEIDALPEFFLTRWWNGLGGIFAVKTWTIVAMVFLWLGLAGLTWWLLGRVRLYKKIGFVAGVSLLILSMLGFMIANSRNHLLQNSGRAVVLEQEIVLRSAPDEKSQEIFRLHAGATIKLLDQIGDWHKVALLNGEQGWLSAQAFEQI